MFDRVAGRYDLTNDVLAVGQTRKWRRLVTEAVDPQPGQRVLDLAAGTGTSSESFVRVGAQVVPCDFSLGMLQVGRKRLPHLPFVAGDAMTLPFADASFDAVTISFGLRNIHDPAQGLREMRRVTRPGGRLVVCEFSTPVWPPFRTIYQEYLMKALPQIAKRVAHAHEGIRLHDDVERVADSTGRRCFGCDAKRVKGCFHSGRICFRTGCHVGDHSAASLGEAAPP